MALEDGALPGRRPRKKPIQVSSQSPLSLECRERRWRRESGSSLRLKMGQEHDVRCPDACWDAVGLMMGGVVEVTLLKNSRRQAVGI